MRELHWAAVEVYVVEVVYVGVYTCVTGLLRVTAWSKQRNV